MKEYLDKLGNPRSPFKWELEKEGFSKREIKDILKKAKSSNQNGRVSNTTPKPKVTDKHLLEFQNSVMRDDEVLSHWLVGYIGSMMGKGNDIQKNGIIALTNQRVCFFRKGMLGQIFEGIDLSKVSSVQHKSSLGHRTIVIHTSGTDIEFKTMESKDRFNILFQKIENLLEKKTVAKLEVLNDDIGKLEKLKKLVDSGIITEAEFQTKKQEILDRI